MDRLAGILVDKLGVERCKSAPQLYWRPSRSADPQSNETTECRSFAGALMSYVLDRADAQLEVSTISSCLRAPTTRAMEALRRVTGYLLGMEDACITLSVQSGDPVLVELVGLHRKLQSSGHVDANGCPIASFSRGQSCVATSSGVAEYFAMCSTAEEPLHMRSVLDHFEFNVWDRAACWIGKGQGLGGEDALAARNCSSWTANQVDVFEGEEGRFGDETSTCGQAELFASRVWDRGPWRNSL